MAINLAESIKVAGNKPADIKHTAIETYGDIASFIQANGAYVGLTLYIKDNSDDPVPENRKVDKPAIYVYTSLTPSPAYFNLDQKLVLLENLLNISEGSGGGVTSEEIAEAISGYFVSHPSTLPGVLDTAVSDYFTANPIDTVTSEELAEAISNYFVDHPVDTVTSEELETAIGSYFEDHPVLNETVIQELTTDEVSALVNQIISNTEFQTEIINVVDADAIKNAIEAYIEENDIDLTQDQLDTLKEEFFTYVSENNTALMTQIENAITSIINGTAIQDQVTEIIENITNETTITNIVHELLEQAGDTFITQIIEEVSAERIASAVEDYISKNPIEAGITVTNIEGMTDAEVTALVEKILENVEFTQNITTTIINKVDDNTITTIISDYLDTHSISLSENQLTELKEEFIQYVTQNNTVLEEQINNAITNIVENNNTLIQDIIEQVTTNITEQTTIELIITELLSGDEFVTQIIEQAGDTFVTQIIEQISEDDIIAAVNNYLSKHPSGNGTLTITRNNATLGSFGANSNNDITIDITDSGLVRTINGELPDENGNFSIDISSIKLDIPNEGFVSIEDAIKNFVRKDDVGDGILKFRVKKGDDYETIQIFTANQKEDSTVDIASIDAETEVIITQVNANWNAESGEVGFIANKPQNIVTGQGGRVNINQGGVSKGGFYLNQPTNIEINLDAVSSGGTGGETPEPIDLSEYVKAVNGNGPDENGNVEVDFIVPGAEEGDPDRNLSDIISTLATKDEIDAKIGKGNLTINIKNSEGEIVETTVFNANDISNKTINFTTDENYQLEQIQSDWNETNSDSPAYIANKPTITKPSDATITIKQGGITKGTFTLNGNAATINLASTVINPPENGGSSADFIRILNDGDELYDNDSYIPLYARKDQTTKLPVILTKINGAERVLHSFGNTSSGTGSSDERIPTITSFNAQASTKSFVFSWGVMNNSYTTEFMITGPGGFSHSVPAEARSYEWTGEPDSFGNPKSLLSGIYKIQALTMEGKYSNTLERSVVMPTPIIKAFYVYKIDDDDVNANPIETGRSITYVKWTLDSSVVYGKLRYTINDENLGTVLKEEDITPYLADGARNFSYIPMGTLLTISVKNIYGVEVSASMNIYKETPVPFEVYDFEANRNSENGETTTLTWKLRPSVAHDFTITWEGQEEPLVIGGTSRYWQGNIPVDISTVSITAKSIYSETSEVQTQIIPYIPAPPIIKNLQANINGDKGYAIVTWDVDYPNRVDNFVLNYDELAYPITLDADDRVEQLSVSKSGGLITLKVNDVYGGFSQATTTVAGMLPSLPSIDLDYFFREGRGAYVYWTISEPVEKINLQIGQNSYDLGSDARYYLSQDCHEGDAIKIKVTDYFGRSVEASISAINENFPQALQFYYVTAYKSSTLNKAYISHNSKCITELYYTIDGGDVQYSKDPTETEFEIVADAGSVISVTIRDAFDRTLTSQATVKEINENAFVFTLKNPQSYPLKIGSNAKVSINWGDNTYTNLDTTGTNAVVEGDASVSLSTDKTILTKSYTSGGSSIMAIVQIEGVANNITFESDTWITKVLTDINNIFNEDILSLPYMKRTFKYCTSLDYVADNFGSKQIGTNINTYGKFTANDYHFFETFMGCSNLSYFGNNTFGSVRSITSTLSAAQSATADQGYIGILSRIFFGTQFAKLLNFMPNIENINITAINTTNNYYGLDILTSLTGESSVITTIKNFMKELKSLIASINVTASNGATPGRILSKMFTFKYASTIDNFLPKLSKIELSTLASKQIYQGTPNQENKILDKLFEFSDTGKITNIMAGLDIEDKEKLSDTDSLFKITTNASGAFSKVIESKNELVITDAFNNFRKFEFISTADSSSETTKTRYANFFNNVFTSSNNSITLKNIFTTLNAKGQELKISTGDANVFNNVITAKTSIEIENFGVGFKSIDISTTSGNIFKDFVYSSDKDIFVMNLFTKGETEGLNVKLESNSSVTSNGNILTNVFKSKEKIKILNYFTGLSKLESNVKSNGNNIKSLFESSEGEFILENIICGLGDKDINLTSTSGSIADTLFKTPKDISLKHIFNGFKNLSTKTSGISTDVTTGANIFCNVIKTSGKLTIDGFFEVLDKITGNSSGGYHFCKFIEFGDDSEIRHLFGNYDFVDSGDTTVSNTKGLTTIDISASGTNSSKKGGDVFSDFITSTGDSKKLTMFTFIEYANTIKIISENYNFNAGDANTYPSDNLVSRIFVNVLSNFELPGTFFRFMHQLKNLNIYAGAGGTYLSTDTQRDTSNITTSIGTWLASNGGSDGGVAFKNVLKNVTFKDTSVDLIFLSELSSIDANLSGAGNGVAVGTAGSAGYRGGRGGQFFTEVISNSNIKYIDSILNGVIKVTASGGQGQPGTYSVNGSSAVGAVVSGIDAGNGGNGGAGGKGGTVFNLLTVNCDSLISVGSLFGTTSKITVNALPGKGGGGGGGSGGSGSRRYNASGSTYAGTVGTSGSGSNAGNAGAGGSAQYLNSYSGNIYGGKGGNGGTGGNSGNQGNIFSKLIEKCQTINVAFGIVSEIDMKAYAFFQGEANVSGGAGGARTASYNYNNTGATANPGASPRNNSIGNAGKGASAGASVTSAPAGSGGGGGSAGQIANLTYNTFNLFEGNTKLKRINKLFEQLTKVENSGRFMDRAFAGCTSLIEIGKLFNPIDLNLEMKVQNTSTYKVNNDALTSAPRTREWGKQQFVNVGSSTSQISITMYTGSKVILPGTDNNSMGLVDAGTRELKINGGMHTEFKNHAQWSNIKDKIIAS
jgi:hypothetical protein